jgi:HEAT repeat protein
MGFFKNLFGGSEESFVKKHVSRILNKYTQKEIRDESFHALAQRGTPEAIYGLLQRFTYDHPESIVDENEKYKVIALLDSLGSERVGEPIRRYIREQTQVSMALIALERIEGEEETQAEIIKQLSQCDPGDTWSADRKLQLIGHLDNYDDLIEPEMLCNFLQDVNDDVVFRCIDVLAKGLEEDDEALRNTLREKLIGLLPLEETSMRIRARILDLALKSKWYIGDMKKELEDKLPEGYFFDKRGHIKTR